MWDYRKLILSGWMCERAHVCVYVTEKYHWEFGTFLTKSIATPNSNEKSVQPSNKYTIYENMKRLLCFNTVEAFFFSSFCFALCLLKWLLKFEWNRNAWGLRLCTFVLIFFSFFSLSYKMKHRVYKFFLRLIWLCLKRRKRREKKNEFNPIPLDWMSDAFAELVLFCCCCCFFLHSNHWKTNVYDFLKMLIFFLH